MTTELKPCPLCKGECSTHSRTEIEDDSVVCDDCKHATEANTLEEAIRLHNSIPRGEKCRWSYINEQRAAFKTSCNRAANAPFLGNYCPHCGKEIEEIKG